MPRPDTNVLVLEDFCAIGDFGRTFVTVLVTRRITHAVTPAANAFLLNSFLIFSLVGLNNETTELQRCSPELVAAPPLDPIARGAWPLPALDLASRRRVPAAAPGPAIAEPSGGIALPLFSRAVSLLEQLQVLVVPHCANRILQNAF